MTDPNAILPRDYRMCSVEMKDGRVFTGTRVIETRRTLVFPDKDPPFAS